jgi:hypothetical protein
MNFHFWSFIFTQAIWASAFACEITSPKMMGIVLDPEKKSWQGYNDVDWDQTGPITVNSCNFGGPTSANFIMLGFGIDSPKIIATIVDTVFNNDFIDDTCRIENSPFVTANNDRKEWIKSQSDFMYACTSLVVSNLSDAKLEVSKTNNCVIENQTKSSVELRGSTCFIKNNTGLDLVILPRINRNCLNPEILEKAKLARQTFYARLNFYLAADDSGNSLDLNPKRSIPFEWNVLPKDKKRMSAPTTELTEPLWPTDWNSDVYAADVSIQGIGTGSFAVSAPFVINNRCARVCADQNCHSPCDFPTAIAAEINLKVKHKNRPTFEYLHTWYGGGVAPSHWQGVLSDRFERIDYTLKSGDQIEIESVFGRPEEDYAALRENLSISGASTSLDKDSLTSPMLSPIRPLDGFSDLPLVNPIPGIEGGENENLDLTTDQFGLSMKNMSWPPEYKSTCSGNSCVSLKRKWHTKTKVRIAILTPDLRKIVSSSRVSIKPFACPTGLQKSVEASVGTIYSCEYTSPALPSVNCD